MTYRLLKLLDSSKSFENCVQHKRCSRSAVFTQSIMFWKCTARESWPIYTLKRATATLISFWCSSSIFPISLHLLHCACYLWLVTTNYLSVFVWMNLANFGSLDGRVWFIFLKKMSAILLPKRPSCEGDISVSNNNSHVYFSKFLSTSTSFLVSRVGSEVLLRFEVIDCTTGLESQCC